MAPRATTIGNYGRALSRRLVGPHALVRTLRLRNVSAIGCVLTQVREWFCAMIALVSYGILYLLLAAGLLLIDLGLVQAVFQRHCVVIIGVVNLGGQDHFRFQIDDVLRLVGEVRRAVL